MLLLLCLKPLFFTFTPCELLAGDLMNFPVPFRLLPDEKSGGSLPDPAGRNQTTCEILAGRKFHSYIYKLFHNKKKYAVMIAE
jgi:hypothetical protein